MIGLLLIVIALIAYGSLYPWQFDFTRHPHALRLLLHNWPHAWNRIVLRDVAINLLLYAPLGALAFLTTRPRRARAAALAAALAVGFVLSASMELLQAYDDHRETSPLDLATNTAGAGAGALLALVFEPAAESLGRRRDAVRSGGPAALLAACWAVFQFYPFFPIFSTSRLRAAMALLLHAPSLNPVEIWAGAAEWFALALAVEPLVGRIRTGWLPAAMLLISTRFFIVTRTAGWSDLLAPPLALALWCAIPSRWRLRAGLCIVLSAIAFRELAPFHWSAHAARFFWIPFSATLESERQSAVVIFLRKAFDYGAAVWLWRVAGWPYLRSGVVVAGALFALELLQRHLPGRTPETTDAVLALLMTLALWLTSPHSAAPRLASGRASDSAGRRGLA